jgi:hypothetical protein
MQITFPTQFRDNWPALAPPWLRTGNAERFMYTLELSRDYLCEKAFQATTIRIPGLGDPSQIPYLAFDRQLQQGPAEPNASFLGRLQASLQTWGLAGSRAGILQQLQAYLQNLQPGVPLAYPEITIVGGCYDTVTTWSQIYFDTPLSGAPTLTTVMPSNFNWDGKSIPWRAWLILPMAIVPTGQSGSSAQTSTAAASACFTDPGQNVNGVWVPATSGTPVNSPWLTITDLAGLTAENLGQWLVLSGSSNPGNNDTFPIVTILSETACVIANPNGVASDTGPLTWSIGEYPYIGPGLVWGTPGYTFGEGELSTPALDTGSNVGGVWQPTIGGEPPPTSWGLDVSAAVIQSIREILGGPGAGWKSSGTWYHNVIISFAAGSGVAGDEYSPNSSPGSGNPDGTFGSVGKLVDGVWVPTRLITSPFTCYCQGTESWRGCTVPNLT